MALRLVSIRFNHNPASATTSAMNIRRNKEFEVPLPEFRADRPLALEQTGAAYAIAETANHTVTIQVVFALSEPAPDQGVEYQVQTTGGGVMGALDPITVAFESGTSNATITIPLSNRQFAEVKREDISWVWTAQLTAGGAWEPLATTQHRIYVLLALPPEPWTQAFGNRKNPWTELLDVCCQKAAGSRDAAQATRSLTKAINGDYGLKYEINSGDYNYQYVRSGSAFNLTRWIDYALHGNTPASPVYCAGQPEEERQFRIVNCYDVTASLALMAQVVGANASYNYHQPFGQLKYIVPIGRVRSNNPFYGCGGSRDAALGADALRMGFDNHTYVKVNDRNFDACMREWVEPRVAAVFFLLWFLLLCITFGAANVASFLDRAGGWLVDLPQADYQDRTIDRSTPREASAAGRGTPHAEVLDFMIA